MRNWVMRSEGNLRLEWVLVVFVLRAGGEWVITGLCGCEVVQFGDRFDGG